MTVDECRGWRPSDAGSSANGSTDNSGKPPASDGQPRPEPNATSGPNRHPSTQKHNCTSWTRQEHRDSFQSLTEEVSEKSYIFSNGGHSPMPGPASSHEYQISGLLDHIIPGRDIPRSISDQQYRTNLEAWYIRISNDSPEVKPQVYAPRTGAISSDPNEGLSGPSGPRDQQGPEVRHKKSKKQHALVTKSQDAEHRQLDLEPEPGEDADTDDEPSQEPRWNAKDDREN